MKKPINRNTWVISKLRFASLRWPQRSEALKNARVERGLYECAMCKGRYASKQVHLDHIEPVVPLNNPLNYMEVDWNTYIPRLFCMADEFQVICTVCHDAKTQMENTMRRSYNDIKRAEKKTQKKIDKKNNKE